MQFSAEGCAMPTEHSRVSARYRKLPEPSLPAGASVIALPAYPQRDSHSCGFLAVLTVVQYFRPDVAPGAVLEAVRPSVEAGCDQARVICALWDLGVVAVYRDHLGPRSLARLADQGLPVIVTVWPEDYGCDHWTVVRGVDVALARVYLTNCEYTGRDGGLAWDAFAAMWFPHGGGLICRFAV
jgi:hypothetical protein